ncbi:MAG: aldehyde dehydrogenase family protein [Rhizobiales bacterium]|nr:aldehyde dehydrogenase family protein [Hyphomicrobiales bacterium]
MRQLHIGGTWRPPLSGAGLDVVDPATETVIATVANGGEADIDAAVGAARAAFPAWRRTSATERANMLAAIAAAITARRDELARIEVRDNGKPLPEALWDIDDAAGCFSYYAKLAGEPGMQDEVPVTLLDARFTSYVKREPVGVAGLIIPWNYPLLMAAWKVAPALAAGATCVLKPSELTPLSALELGTIASEAGLPAGVLNIVTGDGATGRALSRHPGIDKIAFTGSVPTGVAVMTAAAQDIKNVSLELGGKSAFIVFDDADIDQAVEWIMFGIFWNQGQVCSATSRLIVQERIAPRLLERLVAATRMIRIGNGMDDGVQLGPLVSRGQHDKVMRSVVQAQADGARLLTGGGRPAGLARGFFMEPTIFADVAPDAALWTEEIFGPVLAVRSFAEEDEAIAMANDTRFGLAAAIMSEDLARCHRVAHAMEAGIVWINCSQPTFTEAPWGGVKRSGIGRELGRWGLENYLAIKQVTRFDTRHTWGWYLGRDA